MTPVGPTVIASAAQGIQISGFPLEEIMQKSSEIMQKCLGAVQHMLNSLTKCAAFNDGKLRVYISSD